MQEAVYAEMAHVYVLSAAVGQSTVSYFPPQLNNEVSAAFCRLVSGRNVLSSKSVVTLMWTSTVTPKNAQLFNVNHFVPLVSNSSLLESYTCTDSNCTFGRTDLPVNAPEVSDIQTNLSVSCNEGDSDTCQSKLPQRFQHPQASVEENSTPQLKSDSESEQHNFEESEIHFTVDTTHSLSDIEHSMNEQTRTQAENTFIITNSHADSDYTHSEQSGHSNYSESTSHTNNKYAPSTDSTQRSICDSTGMADGYLRNSF